MKKYRYGILGFISSIGLISTMSLQTSRFENILTVLCFSILGGPLIFFVLWVFSTVYKKIEGILLYFWSSFAFLTTQLLVTNNIDSFVYHFGAIHNKVVTESLSFCMFIGITILFAHLLDKRKKYNSSPGSGRKS